MIFKPEGVGYTSLERRVLTVFDSEDFSATVPGDIILIQKENGALDRATVKRASKTELELDVPVERLNRHQRRAQAKLSR